MERVDEVQNQLGWRVQRPIPWRDVTAPAIVRKRRESKGVLEFGVVGYPHRALSWNQPLMPWMHMPCRADAIMIDEQIDIMTSMLRTTKRGVRKRGLAPAQPGEGEGFDPHALALWRSVAGGCDRRYGYASSSSTFGVLRAHVSDVLQTLAAADALRLACADALVIRRSWQWSSLQLDLDQPFEFDIAADVRGELVRATGSFRRDAIVLPYTDVLHVGASLFAWQGDDGWRLSRCAGRQVAQWVYFCDLPVAVEAHERAAFFAHLQASANADVGMRFAFAGDVTQVNAALNASVCFTKQERGTMNIDVAWKANIDGKEVDLPEPLAQWQPDDGVLHTMDPLRVAELTQGLAALGYQRGKVWNVPLARVANVVDELVRLRCEIWWEKQRFTKEPTLDIRTRSGIEWIDVEVSFGEGEQRIDLPALLRSVQRRASMVRLADGSVARLTTEARLRLELLLRAAKKVDVNLLRFASNEAAMVDELASVADGGVSGTFTRDDAFAELCERARSYTAPPAVAPPADFAATLRPYQLEGLAWLQQLARERRGGCLADDMGLGKTVQVLAHLLALHRPGPEPAASGDAAGRRLPSLIIAPVSLLTHWRNEAARFAPTLRTLSWYRNESGTLAQVAELADVVVTSHGTVRQHAAEFAARPWLAVVIDEAQAIKNETTNLAGAVRELTATHRLALSGTPMENRLRDVASLFRFLQPAVAAPGTALHNVCQPIDPDVDPDGILARKAAVTVGRLLAPYMLRRTKREVLTELPSKTELTVEIELSTDERAFYKSMLEQFIQQGVARSSFGGATNPELLAAILRLRQAALHRGLVDSTFMQHSSSKVEFLIERLVELGAAGHRALVFSQFTSLLQIVSARLRAQRISFEYLDGRTRDRGAVVDRFQAPTGAQVFLISLRAGGAGLNLTAADYVFLLDPWWNPAVEAQAIDRVHRIGQQRPVTAYRLVAQDTIETKMQLLQEKKRGLVQGLFGDQAGIGSLTAEDLASLFS